MSFKHYICTRYNLGLFSTQPYKDKVKDPEGWMERRIGYFEALLNSLEAQTCQNFTYLCFMDMETPKKYIEDVNRAILRHLSASQYKIILDVPFNFFRELKINSKWNITTRIDNDDYYLPDFVKYVQGAFNFREEVIDTGGMQFKKATGEYFTSGRRRPNSPFISFVEKTGNIKTVFDQPHSSMPDKYGGRFATREPQWIQVIHDENISNTIRGTKI